MRRAGLGLAWVILLSAGASNSLGAQSVSMRLGGVQARYADSVSATAGSVGVLGSWDHASWRLTGDATYSQFTGSGSATQAQLGGGWVRPVGTGAAWGIQGAAGGSFLSNGVSAWTGVAQGFAAATGRGWLVLAGASAGTARTVAATREGLYGTLLRFKRDAGPFTLEATAASTWAGTRRFTDFTGAVEWVAEDGAARLGGGAGTRLGDLSGKPLLQLHGEIVLKGSGGVAVEGAVGRYPEDVTGFTSGVFANLGIRIPLSRAAREPVLRHAAIRARRAITVEAGDSGRIRVTVDVPDASRVAIAGEWNQWSPVPMTQVGEHRWQIQLPLQRGAWRFALEVDGGRWIVPAGVPKLPDDFGGEVGVLVIG